MSITTIPPEILVNILQTAIDADDRSTQATALELRLVCKRWKEFLTPQVFKKIKFSPDIASCDRAMKLVTDHQARAMARCVEIDISFVVDQEYYQQVQHQVQQLGRFLDSHPFRLFHSVIFNVAMLPHIETVVIRCSTDRSGQESFSADTRPFFELQHRLHTIRIVKIAFEYRMSHSDSLGPIPRLTVTNLQNVANTAEFPHIVDHRVGAVSEHRDLPKLNFPGVEELVLTVQMETIMGLSVLIPGEQERFNRFLNISWLQPASANLTSLTIHMAEPWGTVPGNFDGGDFEFPKLRSLTLGNFSFSDDSHVDWVLRQTNLTSLRLYRCTILAFHYFPLADDQGPHTEDNHEEINTNVTNNPAAEDDSLVHRLYQGTWETIYSSIRERLPNLIDFQSSYNTHHFDEFAPPPQLGITFSKHRYLSFDSRHYTPWEEVSVQDATPRVRVIDQDMETEVGDRRAFDALVEAVQRRRS